MAAFLGRRGYEVTVVENGRLAFEAATRAVPDVVITDVNMPEMDGLELVRRLKAHPATSRVPVIVMTATKSLGDMVRREVGADAYLIKPVQLSMLAATVQEVMGTVRAQA